MDLSERQVASARAHGCVFFPASPEQVARLSMQRRIFRIEGRPFVATRDGGGFHETHATLARLVEPEADGPAAVVGGAAETVDEAEAADAASAREIEGERGAGPAAKGAQVVRRPRATARPRAPWRSPKGAG